MLAGDEEILRRRALDDILKAAGIEKDDFELQVLDADSSAPADWVASVSTAPFMSPRRTTIVRHLFRCDIDKLKKVKLANVPDTGLLILVGDDEGSNEEKALKMKTARTAWEKAVKAADGATLGFDPDPNSARAGVKEEVTRRGKTITERAANALVEMTGGSLSRALDEVDKLILFLGDAPSISETDVRSIVVPSREWKVFTMVNAIIGGRVPEALTQLRILITVTSKAEDQAFRSILPNISRQLRLLWQARLCIEAGKNPGDPAMASKFPDRPNLAKEQSYSQGQAMTGARRVSLGGLQKAFAILSDTDSRLKGALDSFSGIDTLERMIIDLAEALSGSTKR